MLTAETFTNCLEHIFPCTGLIYVGAGNGSALNGERFNRISKLLAIEADDLAFSYLARNLQNRTGWTALKALVGEDDAETSFYAASNPNESGLLNPDALKSVWRNLTCLEGRPQASTSLSSVLQNECQAKSYNWLSIDCLPSALILHGLEKHLEQFDVIDVRVLDRAAGVLNEGCTKAECDTLLTPLGYQIGFVEEATNPMVQRVLYVRDGHASLEIHTERLNQRYQFEIEQLTQGKAIAEKLATERAQQAENATKAKDEHAKLAQERQAKIEQLTQAKSAAEKLATERALRIEQQAFQPKQVAQAHTGGDADIDAMISDLAIFFTEQSITFVDVGSYVGEVFLKIYRSGKIKIREAHLYEPNPQSYKLLTENIHECKTPSLHAYNMAISDKAGPLNFIAALSMTKVTPASAENVNITNTFSATAVRLDEQVMAFTDKRINFLKIDAEGVELDVLRSAADSLKNQNIDVIYIEVGFNKNGTQQTYFANVDDFLQERGYRVFKIYEQRNEWIDDSPLLRRCNFAYMSQKFAGKNPLKLLKKIEMLKNELSILKK